ncbi:MAG: helix-turn-helix transcriptional regulator [Mycobacteriaceae bacterium]|nr:helix-turn-helix transcriptional regulator [Mycobacteriaceae bacterium]
MADRPRRADARRNYELVLSAARDVFDELGVNAPLDEVARRAGVGNATMYRHFPTRGDMVIAVYAEEVTALGELGRTLLDDPAPVDALFSWLRAFVGHVSTKSQLPLAIPDDEAGGRSELYREWHETMRTAAADLLRRAQRAGAVDPGLDLADLLAATGGVARAATDAPQADRLLAIIRAGISR